MSPPDVPKAGLWPLARLTPRQVDGVVTGTVALVAGGGLAEAALVAHRPHLAVALATLPFVTLPLLWRRSHPGTVLATLAAAFTVAAVSGWPMPQGVGLVFGAYAAALYGDRRVRVVAGSVAAGALAVAFAVMLTAGSALALEHLSGMAFGYGVAWVLGDHTRIRHAYLAELTERADRLERERDDFARRATEEERSRIARELHDVVAHNVSVIAVQAGAARVTVGTDPGRAVQALDLIERTARSALSELRLLLGILRRSDAPADLRRPHPGLDRLDELVDQAREAGLRLQARVQGETRPLSGVVDVCAYRIVQEALTNALKHATGADVYVLVRYGSEHLVITVVDDGPGASCSDTTPGHGLIGMRERVALVGGQLHVGTALAGGFRVEARLPLRGADATAPRDLAASDGR